MCNPFPAAGNARGVYPQQFTGYFPPSVRLYWSSRQKIRCKPWENASRHVAPDEKLTCVCIQTEGAEPTRWREVIWKPAQCFFFFSRLHVVYRPQAWKHFLLDWPPWINQWGRKQKVVKTRGGKKWICRISHKGKSLFPIQRMVHLLSPRGRGWRRARNTSY